MSMDEDSNIMSNLLDQDYEAKHFRRLYLSIAPQESNIQGYSQPGQKSEKDEQREEQKVKKKKKRKKRKPKRKYSSDYEMNTGHWSEDENRIYHLFLEAHSQNFINKNLRREDKIFKSMTTYITSRKSEQCRSHHQKIQKKHQNFYEIIHEMRLAYYGSCSPDAIRQELRAKKMPVQGCLISQQQIEFNIQSIKIQQSNRKGQLLHQSRRTTFTNFD